MEISIIIPNFNKASFIEQTLSSIFEQSYQNWEALIVDDGSTDNSMNILRDWAEKDPRFKVFQREGKVKGGSVCRNIGLSKAQGEYVIFLDSDDLLSSNCLEERVQVMEKKRELDFSVFPMQAFILAVGDSASYWRPTHPKPLDSFLRHELPWAIPQPIWKRSFLEQLGGFTEVFPRLQDVELHTRALFHKGVRYEMFPREKADCFYRIDQSRTKINQKDHLKRFSKGVQLYIEQNEQAAREKGIVHLLKGSLLAFYTQLFLARVNQEITKSELEELLMAFKETTAYTTLVERRERLLLNSYKFFYLKGAYKVKGFNFLMRKLFIR